MDFCSCKYMLAKGLHIAKIIIFTLIKCYCFIIIFNIDTFYYNPILRIAGLLKNVQLARF